MEHLANQNDEARPMTTKTLTVRQRKSIFHALVQTQDSGIPVAESKKKVAAEYRLSREQLELIEKEGVDKDWPPLA
jgi:predicted transcriptional regulator